HPARHRPAEDERHRCDGDAASGASANPRLHHRGDRPRRPRDSDTLSRRARDALQASDPEPVAAGSALLSAPLTNRLTNESRVLAPPFTFEAPRSALFTTRRRRAHTRLLHCLDWHIPDP